MTKQSLLDKLTQLLALAEQIASEAESISSQQHEAHATETLRSVSKGSLALADRARAMAQAVDRL